ncbi:Pkinase protein [Rhizoctonia solani]|uniref:Pkinase protein n=1 Tax=Rhizoctonia solani TaxID=456999 RepID=A0A8H7IGX5_9AGAM|nr:Pkinase protein [Rhizoctonia solani]
MSDDSDQSSTRETDQRALKLINVGLGDLERPIIAGLVRVATHKINGQMAAVKIMSTEAIFNSRMSVDGDPEQAERIIQSIEREIVIMKLLEHPNILGLLDVWEAKGLLFVIMEYIDGGELFDYIVEKGRIPIPEAIHYFQQVMYAVAYCHRFRIAHHFGMAAFVPRDSFLYTSCGSPHYASPEVVSGLAYNGAISDVWSCGVILYALLSGKLPFDDEDIRALLGKVREGNYSIPADIPWPAQNLIRRMMEKDVDRRIEVVEVLQHPFFRSITPRILPTIAPTFDHLAGSVPKGIGKLSIDNDIMKNMRTLWRNRQDSDIIRAIYNPHDNWEKIAYHLLYEFRTKSVSDGPTTSNPTSPIAPTAPLTPRKRTRTEPIGNSSAETLPEIVIHQASPTKKGAKKSSISSTQAHWTVCAIDGPEMEGDMFFHQITEMLVNMSNQELESSRKAPVSPEKNGGKGKAKLIGEKLGAMLELKLASQPGRPTSDNSCDAEFFEPRVFDRSFRVYRTNYSSCSSIKVLSPRTRMRSKTANALSLSLEQWALKKHVRIVTPDRNSFVRPRKRTSSGSTRWPLVSIHLLYSPIVGKLVSNLFPFETDTIRPLFGSRRVLYSQPVYGIAAIAGCACRSGRAAAATYGGITLRCNLDSILDPSGTTVVSKPLSEITFALDKGSQANFAAFFERVRAGWEMHVSYRMEGSLEVLDVQTGQPLPKPGVDCWRECNSIIYSAEIKGVTVAWTYAAVAAGGKQGSDQLEYMRE